jgi:hypothetical protein
MRMANRVSTLFVRTCGCACVRAYVCQSSHALPAFGAVSMQMNGAFYSRQQSSYLDDGTQKSRVKQQTEEFHS